ncbi:UNVERIFIED_ORG: hypothetical protein ABIC97_004458 [Peribacillus simplex]
MVHPNDIVLWNGDRHINELTGALVLEGVEFPAPRKSAEKKDLRLKILFAACELNFPVNLNSDI